MANELIVGYDGSACAEAALIEAAALAGHLGCSLVVASAAEPPAVLAGGAGDQRRLLHQRGDEILKQAGETVDQTGVAATYLVVDARPAQGLLDLAERYDARMIVIGTYGEAPLVGAILGSTPHKLLHLSTRPVLVVPAPA